MSTYRFLYDARGKSLTVAQTPVAPAPQPARPPVAPAPQSASPPVATAPQSTPPPVVAAPQPAQSPSSQEWEPGVKSSAVDLQPTPWDPVQFVIDLKEWLEDHPDFGLELDLLEEREILKTPPHWSYVSNDIEVHRSNPASAPSWDEQRRAADQYANMLLGRQTDVEKAVELAAFASVASDKLEPDGRMHDALRALPKGGKVDQKIFSEIPRPTGRMPSVLPNVEPWANALLERYEQIVKRTLDTDWLKVETDSWLTWETRFRAYRKRGRQRPFEVDRNDLLLRTKKAGPAVLFRNELAQMTLREWTEALFAAAGGVPPPRSLVPIPDWVRGQIETELMSGRKTLLIILGNSDTSPSSQWLPSRSNGCLWIPREQWLMFFNRLWNTLNIGKDANHWIIVAELSGDSKTLAIESRQYPVLSTPTNPDGSVTVAYMAKDKLPPEVTPIVPYVDNPKSVDDLVSRIESLKGRSQSAS